MIEGDVMKTEQSYRRLMQALLDMKKNFEEQIRNFEDQLHHLGQDLVRQNIDELRNIFEEKKAALTECTRRIDRRILDCVAQVEEYRRLYADLKALSERLHALGADSVELPEPIAADRLGALMEARLAKLGAESGRALELAGAQAKTGALSQEAAQAIELEASDAVTGAPPRQGDGAVPAGDRTATVPAGFFERMTQAATEAMGPMAPRVIREKLSRLGEAREAFPVAKLETLVESVGQEILNETMRRGFQDRMLQEIRALRTVRG